MNTNDILLLKALQLKQTIEGDCSSDLVDHILEQNPQATKEAMRNICAFISPELFQRVESVCSNLSLSKRQVVEMALIDFMEKADNVINKVNPFDSLVLEPVGNEAEGE
ncbi:MAG: hypothetical protein WCI20_13830 [bacterium]